MSRLIFKDTTITNNDTEGIESAFDKPIGYKTGQVSYNNMKLDHFVTKQHLEGVVGGGSITESDHNTQYVYQKIFDYTRANEMVFRNASQMEEGIRDLNELDYITKRERDDADALMLEAAKLYTDENGGGGGSQGPPGKDGVDGEDGPPGKDGEDGADGTNGTDGVNGTDGAQGAVGPMGPIGPMGPAGEGAGDDEFLDVTEPGKVDVMVNGDEVSLNQMVMKLKNAGQKFKFLSPTTLVAEECEGEYRSVIQYTSEDIGEYRELFVRHRNGTITKSESQILGTIFGAIQTGIKWLPKVNSILSGLFGGKRPKIQHWRFDNARANLNEMKDYLKTINPNFLSHIRQNGHKLMQNIIKEQYQVGNLRGVGSLVKKQVFNAAKDWMDKENKWKMRYPQGYTRRFKNMYIEITYDMENIENDSTETVGVRGFTIIYGANLYDKVVVEIGDYVMTSKAAVDTLKSKIENTLSSIVWGDHTLDKDNIKLLNDGPLSYSKVAKYTNHYTIDDDKYHAVYSCNGSAFNIMIDGIAKTGAYTNNVLDTTHFGYSDTNVINGNTMFSGIRKNLTYAEVNANPDLAQPNIIVNGSQLEIMNQDDDNNPLTHTFFNTRHGNNYISGNNTIFNGAEFVQFKQKTVVKGNHDGKTNNTQHLSIGEGNGNHHDGIHNDLCYLRVNGAANASGDGYTYFPHNNTSNTDDGAFAGSNLIRGDTQMDDVTVGDLTGVNSKFQNMSGVIVSTAYSADDDKVTYIRNYIDDADKHKGFNELRIASGVQKINDMDALKALPIKIGGVGYFEGQGEWATPIYVNSLITDSLTVKNSNNSEVIKADQDGLLKIKSIQLNNEQAISSWPPGPKGEDGADGHNGDDGAPGKDGADGAQGVAGKDGVDGADGKNGADGIFNGGQVSGPTIFEETVAMYKGVAVLGHLKIGSNTDIASIENFGVTNLHADVTCHRDLTVNQNLHVDGLVYFSTVMEKVIDKPHGVTYYWNQKFELDGQYFHEDDYDIEIAEQYHHATPSSRNVPLVVVDGYYAFECAIYHPNNNGTGWYRQNYVNAKYAINAKHGNKLRTEVDVLKEKIEKLELLVVKLQN